MTYEDHSDREPPASATRGQLRSRRWRKVAMGIGMAALPLAVGAAVGRRSRWFGVFAGGGTAVALTALRWQLQRWFTDEPDYQVVRRVDGLEVRRYPARIEAQTQIDTAKLDDALDRGFRRLAGYIFGGNRAQESLPMTAPVTTRGEKLAMTAPVIASAREGSFTMGFVMPAGRDVKSLPRPDDSHVRLREVPAREVVVLRFRGAHSHANVARAERLLLRRAAAAKLPTVGKPVFAGFDPPTTLPLLRRNEVWVELDEHSAH